MLRPGSSAEIYKYIEEVARKFDRYVEQEILTKLSTPKLNHDQVLTGLQFIQTRGLSNFQATVIQLLTTYYVGKRAKEVYESGLRAAEWYGIAPRKRGGTLRIDARLDRDELLVEVGDDGVGLPRQGADPIHEGHGLGNVRQRLKTLYGEAASIEILPGPEGIGTVARLRIPLAVALPQSDESRATNFAAARQAAGESP